MTTVIRCPDFPLTKPLRAHLMRRFSYAFRKYRDQTSLVEVSVRSTRQDAYEDADVHVHVKIELEHQEHLEVTAVSHDEYIAASIAARRARRAVKRAIRRYQRIEHHGLRQLAYSPGRPAYDTG
jgi:ribosome-associated translation inhibitor RaiA